MQAKFQIHKQKTASDSGEVLQYERQDGGFEVGSSSATVSAPLQNICLVQCRDNGKVLWHMRTCYSKQERKFNGRLLMRINVYLRMTSGKCRMRDQCPVDTTNLRTVVYNKDEACFNYWLSLNVSVVVTGENHVWLHTVYLLYHVVFKNLPCHPETTFVITNWKLSVMVCNSCSIDKCVPYSNSNFCQSHQAFGSLRSSYGNGNGLLFHMTQPISRSTIKAIACSKPTISEH